MTPSELLSEPALRKVLNALPQARLVGGCVRDVLIGENVSDIDLATPEIPQAVSDALRNAGMTVAPTGVKHGTLTAVCDHKTFEVTTLRRDTDTDGRHATVEWTTDWAVDAARRDFTINAMSMDRDGTVFDYFGGRDDLSAGRVRFVGKAEERIAEDYLRILRFFRFQARYGLEDPDPDTILALRRGMSGLTGISRERVWSEVKKIIVGPRALPILKMMLRLHVDKPIGLSSGNPFHPRAAFHALRHKCSAPVVMACYLGNRIAIETLAIAWRWSLAERRQAVFVFMRGLEENIGLDEARRLAACDGHSSDSIFQSLQVQGKDKQALLFRRWELPVFPVVGADLLEIGFKEDRSFGNTISHLKSIWANSDYTMEKEDLLKEAKKLL